VLRRLAIAAVLVLSLGAPIAERRDTPEGVHVRARLPRPEIARFAPFLVAGSGLGDESEAESA